MHDMIPEISRPVYADVFDKKGDELPPSEPYHVKMIKQTVFNAMLSTKGNGYGYRRKLPGKKFGLFEETETVGDESGEESGEIFGSGVNEIESEEEPEGRTKKKHDSKQRKATSKPFVGGPSQLEEEEEI